MGFSIYPQLALTSAGQILAYPTGQWHQREPDWHEWSVDDKAVQLPEEKPRENEACILTNRHLAHSVSSSGYRLRRQHLHLEWQNHRHPFDDHLRCRVPHGSKAHVSDRTQVDLRGKHPKRGQEMVGYVDHNHGDHLQLPLEQVTTYQGF